MDNNASTMQDDMQLSEPMKGNTGSPSKQNRSHRPPSKIVENVFFCYSVPNAENASATPSGFVSVEESLAHFPKSFEPFLKAASSLPLKFRGWWKTPVVLAWQWLEEPSPTASAVLSVVVGFDNGMPGSSSRAPEWLGSPKTRDQFRRIILEGFRRLFPTVFQQVREVDMQMSEWLQKRQHLFTKLQQISVPSGKAQEYSEHFAIVERDVGLISPQYHKGHLQKPQPKTPKNKKDVPRSPSKRSGSDNADDASPSKRVKTSETDQSIAKAEATFVKPTAPFRAPQSQRPASQSSPTKQQYRPKQPGVSSLPPIVRKKDISPPTAHRTPPSK